MTGRHCAYVVVLEGDVRKDDAEKGILNAIRTLKGVAEVRPVTAEPSAEMIAAFRADREWRDALLELARTGPRRLA